MIVLLTGRSELDSVMDILVYPYKRKFAKAK